MIISLYAGGMTVRDIAYHLEATLGTELSHETISNITDAVAEEILAWQARPLDALYPVIYLDAIVVKVRDGAHVTNKAAHIAVGVDMDGIKHVLGIWIQATEGAKFWAGVCADLANRGDPRRPHRVLRRPHGPARGDRGDLDPGHGPDLCGAPDPRLDAVRELPGPQGRRGGAEDRSTPPPNAEAARRELDTFADSNWGKKYPHAVEDLGGRLGAVHPVPGLPARAAPGHVHHQLIESLNYQLRKVTKNRGHFPNDEAVIKLLWLAICNIEDKRARERAKDRGKPAKPNARPNPASSRARSSPTGKPPWPSSRSSTPTASTPTCNPTEHTIDKSERSLTQKS